MAISARKLYLLMAEQCINARTLAEKAGISRGTIGLILHRGRQPNADTVRKLAKALHVDVKDLLEMGDEK